MRPVTDEPTLMVLPGSGNHQKPSVPDQMDGDVARQVADLVFDFAKMCEDGTGGIVLVSLV